MKNLYDLFLFLQVIGAKVVTNARTPGARCYGYVTMATSDDASKCIQHLHRTELHGRMISVERVSRFAVAPCVRLP
jgi:RNA recognition motif-containing protein